MEQQLQERLRNEMKAPEVKRTAGGGKKSQMKLLAGAVKRRSDAPKGDEAKKVRKAGGGPEEEEEGGGEGGAADRSEGGDKAEGEGRPKEAERQASGGSLLGLCDYGSDLSDSDS